MSDLRTPLAKVRGLGSAKGGTHHWMMQKVTALANIPLVLFVVVSFVGNVGKSHADWVAWFKQPLAAVIMILFVLNTMHHLRLGLQVAVEDYVPSHGNRTLVITLINFVVAILAVLSVFSILRIAFGG
ncbi:succinate dehydrogenase, hydrophobic membrane anchor protein [Kordiimonas sediminis]|uniref:Succinate dehydrogenase hydrophobic membrane anchor subunit n=1 Tax=Kordiimonas sediminis TaxID=1735581 RepID=A0A919E504_9PROT|nr:succinate dehydrogenase, hydrophobic membrane anchor protein [Kordiimonas sediminis]GHF19879.1 succinate dehydrogenase, hydrophobic membrane anchor protein [Kordiimonas sediminis]